MGKINRFLCCILLLGVLPVFLMTFLGKLQMEDLLVGKPKEIFSEIEGALPLLVAKQISIQMPDACIEAQGVIARTTLMAAKEEGKVLPTGFTVEELKRLWGSEFEACYERLVNLIGNTAGKTLRYQDEYIYAAYHQISAGNTRTMSEYYKENTMPYLVSAACHEDAAAKDYLKVYYWPQEEFLDLIKKEFPEAAVESSADICVNSRDSAGYVLEVAVGQTLCEGELFRKTLNLPSACFEITLLEGDVRVVTMGAGHGFGLSQNTARLLAERGKNYQEILNYFYKGAVIE